MRWMILQSRSPLQRDMSMLIGKVKWFNNAKGYGFINEDGKSEDLFAHYSAIKMDGYKTLKAGQPVTFDIIQGPKGLHAVNIAAKIEQDQSTENVASKAGEAAFSN